MSTVASSLGTTSHDIPEVHHEHHHHESFITKYVFSQDHKMIARQFLITGMAWAIIGGLMSVLFIIFKQLRDRRRGDRSPYPPNRE